MEYLKVEQCKDGYLYRISARNARHGIFREKHGDFLILRNKFYNDYLFEEIHWDLSKHFGTVRPIKEIEKSPFTGEDMEDTTKLHEDGHKYWTKKGDYKAMCEYLLKWRNVND